MSSIEIQPLASYPELVEICAAWNLNEFGASEDWGLEELTGALRGIIEKDSGELALIAHCDGLPAGFVLLIECDLESHSHLKPWLASLVVARPFQRRGIGRALVAAIEAAAARRGDKELFLYSSIPDYYRPLGWHFLEELEKEDRRFEIMSKRL
ncbi:GNAT family N-acetyltransferase [Denitrobaculum tricleocarpae]|uniref:GNAT family N-acetyltransferase n=1 Tax=Denitrobaculum tricleocarpae TaxID=2591009 RepID=A0A545U1D6_9PROT|nr:GNAT family N-acetyltransferase [Denitrobaculum tricleocarpae]TQV83292.1 GNAT family N-acetyltransferase [Denitrobaculum tricleocarpae]